ncbi:TetR/AcrR family transcriptional regulator [[Actinomadura] parvosata]|uniref:TetR/AcrR family transcriptional regulator n=1 Tax=[Actinomadura] parvosata TaxID=1955412 RepID=UPI00406C3732
MVGNGHADGARPVRRGRRGPVGATRQDILDAALRLVATRGAAVTIREIGSEAGVDPAMVIYYFRSKKNLQAALALAARETMRQLSQLIHAGDRRTLGVRLVHGFVDLWERPDTGGQMRYLLHGACDEPGLAQILSDAIDESIVQPLVAACPSPRAPMTAGVITAQLTGLAATRYVLRIEPFASTDADALATLLGPLLQDLIDGRRAPWLPGR